MKVENFTRHMERVHPQFVAIEKSAWVEEVSKKLRDNSSAIRNQTIEAVEERVHQNQNQKETRELVMELLYLICSQEEAHARVAGIRSIERCMPVQDKALYWRISDVLLRCLLEPDGRIRNAAISTLGYIKLYLPFSEWLRLKHRIQALARSENRVEVRRALIRALDEFSVPRYEGIAMERGMMSEIQRGGAY